MASEIQDRTHPESSKNNDEPYKKHPPSRVLHKYDLQINCTGNESHPSAMDPETSTKPFTSEDKSSSVRSFSVRTCRTTASSSSFHSDSAGQMSPGSGSNCNGSLQEDSNCQLPIPWLISDYGPITEDATVNTGTGTVEVDEDGAMTENGNDNGTTLTCTDTKHLYSSKTMVMTMAMESTAYEYEGDFIVPNITIETDDSSDENELVLLAGKQPPISCINGCGCALRGKLASLGTSFGSLVLGIQAPVRVIDKVPNDPDPGPDECDADEHDEHDQVNNDPDEREQWMTDVTSLQSSMISFPAFTPSSNLSFRGSTVNGNDSSCTDGSIPFLPELLPGGKVEMMPNLNVSYHPSTTRTCTLNTEFNAPVPTSLIPPRTVLQAETEHYPEVQLPAYIASLEIRAADLEDDVNDMLRMASRYELEGDYASALETYGNCLEFYSRGLLQQSMDCHPELHLDIASVLHNIGVVHWKTGAYEKSLHALKKARRKIEQSVALGGEQEVRPIKEQLCDILNTVGKVYASMGEFERALAQHGESLAILKSLFIDGDGAPTKLAHMNTDDDVSEKEDCIQQSDNELPKENVLHPGIARSLICMGTVHVSCGRLLVAMELFKGGLDIQRKTVGSKHVDVAATLNSIGSVYEKTGRHGKAMQCYKKARRIYTDNLGDDHVDVAVTLNNIGQIYHHIGKHQKSMESYNEALRIMKQVLGKSHRNVAAALYNMGLVHLQCCHYDKALKVFKGTLKLQREALGDDHVDVALTLESIGGIYERRMRIDRALDLYHKALSIRRKAIGDHLFVAFTLDTIGKCQLNLNGNIKEARRSVGIVPWSMA